MTIASVTGYARSMSWIAAIVLTIAGAGAPFSSAAEEAEDDAKTLLKAMSSYVASQNFISAAFDADVEVITPDLENIQFASSGDLRLSRPDKLRVSKAGGYSDVLLVFDGTTATVFDRHNNAFAEVSAPGTVEQIIDRLRDELSITIPGADLLLTDSYERLLDDVVEARHIGQGVIDGVECEHLAFRNSETDWQIWIETGPRPIPRKYVITSKAVAGAPQYTLRIKTWSTDPVSDPTMFAFKPPGTAQKVDIKSLHEIDDVPPGEAVGGSK